MPIDFDFRDLGNFWGSGAGYSGAPQIKSNQNPLQNSWNADGSFQLGFPPDAPSSPVGPPPAGFGGTPPGPSPSPSGPAAPPSPSPAPHIVPVGGGAFMPGGGQTVPRITPSPTPTPTAPITGGASGLVGGGTGSLVGRYGHLDPANYQRNPFREMGNFTSLYAPMSGF